MVNSEDGRKRPREEEGGTPAQPRKWRIKCGERASGIRNPIREVMDSIAGKENPNKRLISLAQGDPTAYPHLRPSTYMVDAAVSYIKDGRDNGYQPSQGKASCRAAIAAAFNVPGRPALSPSDIFMTIGCSEALSHCIATLAASGGNMLLPRPGFPLYEVLCAYHGLEIRYYDLLPNSNWEIDIDNVTQLADDRTVALLVNNPSNPCGAVYSRAHLEKVLGAAERLRLPVIADEVYADMTFSEPYFACAAVSSQLPVLSVCALSKRWLAPGWRVGWVIVHDAHGLFAEAGVQDSLLKLCQVSLGPSAPLQAAIPEILKATPAEWHSNVLEDLRASAECCVARCRGCSGLEIASEPQGAMYFMVRIKPGHFGGSVGDSDDVAFARVLLAEESVAILPGQCFRYPGFFRVVFAAPAEVLEEAWDRIEAFCRRHRSA